MREDCAVPSLVDPGHEQVLEFCSRSPVERVFLEEMALRGGRALRRRSQATTARSQALCHAGANLVPSGAGCGAFADDGGRAATRG